jgi:hypothetical protein
MPGSAEHACQDWRCCGWTSQDEMRWWNENDSHAATCADSDRLWQFTTHDARIKLKCLYLPSLLGYRWFLHLPVWFAQWSRNWPVRPTFVLSSVREQPPSNAVSLPSATPVRPPNAARPCLARTLSRRGRMSPTARLAGQATGDLTRGRGRPLRVTHLAGGAARCSDAMALRKENRGNCGHPMNSVLRGHSGVQGDRRGIDARTVRTCSTVAGKRSSSLDVPDSRLSSSVRPASALRQKRTAAMLKGLQAT